MVEDIKYIKKMQHNNIQLDYTNKMNDFQERRNMRIKEKLDKLDELKQKEEEVHRKRLHMETLKRLKLQQVEDKRRIMAKKRHDLTVEKKR